MYGRLLFTEKYLWSAREGYFSVPLPSDVSITMDYTGDGFVVGLHYDDIDNPGSLVFSIPCKCSQETAKSIINKLFGKLHDVMNFAIVVDFDAFIENEILPMCKEES